MTRKTILATIMVITVIAASITASSIAYAATDPKPKDTAKSFFDVFTQKGFTVDSFFDIFTELQRAIGDPDFDLLRNGAPDFNTEVAARKQGDADTLASANQHTDSFFDVFTELQGNVGNLETQVAQIQSQIGSGGPAQSVDMFIKIDTIPGESTDKDHTDEIDVDSFSWGATQSGSSASGGGAGSGKVSFQDFHFVHKVDKASPKLFEATATGKHIPKVEFTVRKAGDKPFEYIKITMSDVLISGFNAGGSGDKKPTEEVTLNFAKIEFEYTPQDADGKALDKVKAGYDLKAGTKV